MFSKELPDFVVLLCGLLLQTLWPCSPPEILSTSRLNTEQYLGTWYFIAAAGERESDVEMFKPMDSTAFFLQEATDRNTLRLTGAIRIGDQCIRKSWIYHILPARDGMNQEGRPERSTLVRSGHWLDCTDCIFLQETEHQVPLNRLMLYARNASLGAELVKRFQTKVSCLGMKRFVTLPQEKEYCQHNETASFSWDAENE